MTPILPARQNPFAVDRVLQVRYRFQHGDREALLGELERLHYRAAIVGPEGTGKTTLLEDLAAPLAERGFRTRWLRLSREQPRFERAFLRDFFAQLTPQDLVLLDGAEQMSRWAWSRFRTRCRAAGGLLITAHFEGLLPTVLRSTTSPALLREVVAQILGHEPASLAPLLDELYEKHQGNLRLALRELYDLAAERRLEKAEGGGRKNKSGKRKAESRPGGRGEVPP